MFAFSRILDPLVTLFPRAFSILLAHIRFSYETTTYGNITKFALVQSTISCMSLSNQGLWKLSLVTFSHSSCAQSYK
jgi:hypothetical protein